MFLCFLGVLAGGAYWVWENYVPSFERIVPVFKEEYPLFYKGEALGYGAIVDKDGESVKLPLDAVQTVLGSKEPVRYEEANDSIILTTENKVVHFKTEALTATINQKPFKLSFAAHKKDNSVYLPIEPLKELFGLQIDYTKDSSIVTLHLPDELIQRAVVTKEEISVRSGPAIKTPIIESLQAGAELRIWGEEEGWYKVQNASGYVGYAAKSGISLTSIESIPKQAEAQPFIAWKLYGKKINMTWEAIYNRQPDLEKIGELQGVNVVSPTWFELADESGLLRSKADMAYVNWAHARGMQVWALFSNSFKPDLTTIALANYETRLNMIKQLLSYAQIYKLQGINIDFENVHTKDKENLVQFVREMTPLLHEQGLVVSIDVTPKSNSEMWSAFLDREALGKVVDFMMVMAYDEHWAASPVAGSVASLPWVEQSVKRILEEDQVPPEKLVLGIPLYTRVWTEESGEDGKRKVSSKAIGMETVEKLIAEKQLKPEFKSEVGQNYIEYTEGGALKRIWMEDEVSIKARALLAKKYDLAGVATWQRSFQKPQIWNILDKELQSRP
ncbi:glycosyl hydrolase family 18 protein [Paenibacillus roseus]|uniref:glycosyl hydrolase family 18 protein n=1 Tax=Paenibacillus roseus TaxID=2798579 RepID=UPI002FCDF1EF